MRLIVDGRKVPVTDTIRIYQDDPFPGGHRYELTVREVRGWPWNELTRGEQPTALDQKAIFLAIDTLLVGSTAPRPAAASYVLNSVEIVDVGENEVLLSGVCSVVMGSGD